MCSSQEALTQVAFGPLDEPMSLLPGEHACITQTSCDVHVCALPMVKMVHVIKGNNFHPSALRDGMTTVLFSLLSFPSWAGGSG